MSTKSVADLLKQYEDDEVVVVPPGNYRMEITSCTVKDAKKGPNLFLMYRVLSEGEYKGKRVMAGNQVLSEDSASIFFRNMKGLGFDGTAIRAVPGHEDAKTLCAALAPMIKGRIVDVEIEINPYKGDDRNAVAIGGFKLIGTKDAAGNVVEPNAVAPAAQAPPAQPAVQPAPAAPAAQPAAVAPEAQTVAPAAVPVAQPVQAPAAPVAAPAPPPAAPAEQPVQQQPAPAATPEQVAPAAPVAPPAGSTPVPF